MRSFLGLGAFGGLGMAAFFGCVGWVGFCSVYSTVSVTAFGSQLLQGVGRLLRWRERAGGVLRRSNRSSKQARILASVLHDASSVFARVRFTSSYGCISGSWAVRSCGLYRSPPPHNASLSEVRALAPSHRTVPSPIFGMVRTPAAVDDPHISALAPSEASDPHISAAAPEAVDDPHLQRRGRRRRVRAERRRVRRKSFR